jgi:hypothetical protein
MMPPTRHKQQCVPPAEIRQQEGWHWLMQADGVEVPHFWCQIDGQWRWAEDTPEEEWEYLEPVLTPDTRRQWNDEYENTFHDMASDIDQLTGDVKRLAAVLETLVGKCTFLANALGAKDQALSSALSDALYALARHQEYFTPEFREKIGDKDFS